uniref:NADH-ubiquinone oxidoreductase chain 2 n=1 Tax=Trigonopterus selaruensis TaxID=2678945 RepID=A0A7H1KHQ1_9CUCU|nr:NADH dehydrogenase subunit 2 [Trigonopterus selaruensis]QNT26817.1 NADH dehydrogenase subunit 2 [Trigonopterus selaruensis]
MINLYKILFFNLLISSTLISISTLSWFTAWIGLEMNLLAILALMKTTENKFSAEATIKYFIVQAMASSLLLFSIVIFSCLNLLNFQISLMPSLLIGSTLILKMGAAPLHFWLPEVTAGLSWNLVFLILTWQKIAPFILLSYTMKSTIFFTLVIIFSSFISSIQGINQICLRKIMAFSSINHMGWMLSALMSSLNLWYYYFLIYSLMNMNILYFFNKYHLIYMPQYNKMFIANKTLKFLFAMNFLSLGGLPPFIGFYPKWLTIDFLVNNNFFWLSFTLSILTLGTLYFYSRLIFPALTLTQLDSISLPLPGKTNYYFSFINFTLLGSLPLTFSMMSFL